MKIRHRAMLLGMLPALLVTLLLGGYLIHARLADLEASLHARGLSVTRNLAQGALYSVVSGNRAPLHALLQQTLRETDVVHAAVRLPNGTPLAEVGQAPSALRIPLAAGAVRGRRHVAFVVPVVLSELEYDDPFLQDPAGSGERTLAWASVAMSLEGKEVAARRALLASLGFGVLGLVFAGLLVRQLALKGIGPLMQTIETVRRIASGDLDARVPVTARSELRILQADINQMSAALQELQRDMQRRVDAATAELAEQKAAAERANAAKSRFLAAASHDLRQPMHALGLYVEALRPQIEGREAAAILAKIAATVSAMEALFNAILDVSKLDAGVIVPRIEPVSIAGLFGRLADDFQAEAANRGLRLRVRPLPLWVPGDPVLLDRILRNLLANALRYTRQGGVLLAARRHGAGVRLQVWDTGVGIAQEHLGRIFQEFYQVDNPQRDRSQGLGLGLAIVDRLVRLMGFEIGVRSRPGRGTLFNLDIPRLAEPAGEAVPDVPAGLDPTRLHGLVAVVDDDALILDALPDLLAGWGLEVVAAPDADRLFERLPRRPDLLLTDYRLAGGETGIAVAERVAARYAYRPPVAIITGDTAQPSLQEIAAHGYPVLHKPVKPARLRALVRRLLAAGQGEGGGHAPDDLAV
jgi:signal transduction histidine kinase/CheY-like chemotaxis protein